MELLRNERASILLDGDNDWCSLYILMKDNSPLKVGSDGKIEILSRIKGGLSKLRSSEFDEIVPISSFFETWCTIYGKNNRDGYYCLFIQDRDGQRVAEINIQDCELSQMISRMELLLQKDDVP